MNPVRRFRFGPDDRIVLRGVELRWAAQVAGGHVFRLADDPRAMVEHSDEHLWRARCDDALEYDEGYYIPGRAVARLRSDAAHLGDIPDAEYRLIDLKFRICDAFRSLSREKARLRARRHRPVAGSREAEVLRVSRSDKGLRVARDLMWPDIERAENPPDDDDGPRVRGGRTRVALSIFNPQTIGVWLRLLDESDWDILALRTRHRNCGRRRTQVPLALERIMAECAPLYAHESRPTIAGVYDDLRVAVDDYNAILGPDDERLRPPSRKTFQARIRAMDPFATYAARHGIKKARHRFRIVTSGVGATVPGERVEMDEVKLHLQTALTKSDIWKLLPDEAQFLLRRTRLWVSASIDCATRVILGASASVESSTQSSLSTIRMTVSDKSSLAAAVGARSDWTMAVRPQQFVTDNGGTMIARPVRLALAGLRIDHVRTIAGEPSMRGTVERLFSAPNTRLFRRFTGKTFENVVARGDYPAERRASLTAQAIFEILLRYIVDDYHNRPHGGLRGEAPADAWARLTAGKDVRPLPTTDALRAIFGVEVERVVGPRGVRIFGLNYQAKSLQGWHRSTAHETTVPVRVDCENLGRVSARLGDTWVHLDCVSPGMSGMSLRAWRETCSDLRARNAARARIREPMLLDAIRAARALARQGVTVFGLTEAWTTPAEIERANSDLDVGWIMPGMEDGPDLLADSVPATGPEYDYGDDPHVAPGRGTSSVEDDDEFGSQGPGPLDDGPAVPDGYPQDATSTTPDGVRGQGAKGRRRKKDTAPSGDVPDDAAGPTARTRGRFRIE